MKSINNYLNEALIKKDTKLKNLGDLGITDSFLIKEICPEYYENIHKAISDFINKNNIKKVDGPYYDASKELEIEKTFPILNNYPNLKKNSDLSKKFFNFTDTQNIQIYYKTSFRIDLFDSDQSEIGIYGFLDVILFEMFVRILYKGSYTYCSLSIMYQIIK